MSNEQYNNIIRAAKRALRVFIASSLSSIVILIPSLDLTSNWKIILGSLVIGAISGGLSGVSKWTRDEQNIDLKIL